MTAYLNIKFFSRIGAGKGEKFGGLIMNKKCEAILKCDKCETMFETKIWTEITVGEDPKLDHDIFQDRLNFLECETCGNFGYVLYPVTVNDKESGERAVAIPLFENVALSTDPELAADGFSVIEITDKKPSKIFYDFEDLKTLIHVWQGGDDTSFDPPPAERDIEEGLQKSIINENEAAILRNTDWEKLRIQINEQADVNDGHCDFGDERDVTIDLYLKLMSALNYERKVVPLPLRT